MSKLKVLVVDDHWLSRSAISNLLLDFNDHAETIEATNADEAIKVAKEVGKLDLIVFDLNMPGSDPLSTILEIRKISGGAPVLIMTVSERRNDLIRSLDHGAYGYIPKSATKDEILSTFERVLNRQIAFPSSLLEVRSPEGDGKQQSGSRISYTAIQTAFKKLTNRQQEIFRLLADGVQKPEIANRLGLTVHTVRIHTHAICARMPNTDRKKLIEQAQIWKNSNFEDAA